MLGGNVQCSSPHILYICLLSNNDSAGTHTYKYGSLIGSNVSDDKTVAYQALMCLDMGKHTNAYTLYMYKYMSIEKWTLNCWVGNTTSAQVVQSVKTDYVYDKDDVWKWFITSCRWGSSITWLHNSICSEKGESAVSHLKRMERLSELLPSPSWRDSNSLIGMIK